MLFRSSLFLHGKIIKLNFDEFLKKSKNIVKTRPKVRSEAENLVFFQIGLKPMPKDASRRELSKSGSRIEKGALCAELRPFYCSIRILFSMSYINFL